MILLEFNNETRIINLCFNKNRKSNPVGTTLKYVAKIDSEYIEYAVNTVINCANFAFYKGTIDKEHIRNQLKKIFNYKDEEKEQFDVKKLINIIKEQDDVGLYEYIDKLSNEKMKKLCLSYIPLVQEGILA